MSRVPALSIQNLSKTYGNGFSALKDVSLTVPQVDFALLGPNGAGKSTMISIVAPCLSQRRVVRIFGTDLLAEPSKAKQFLGVVPQNLTLISLKKLKIFWLLKPAILVLQQKESNREQKNCSKHWAYGIAR